MERDDKKPKPQFQLVKDFVSDQVTSGTLRPGDRVPSEQELVEKFSVSRMTVNRALKELAAEGVVTRLQGIGSFVAIPRSESAVMEVRDIAGEIAETGQVYSCTPLQLGTDHDPEANRKMGLAPQSPHHRVILLHQADGIPVQLEDRCVNPAFAPDFLTVDFTRTTPHRYLMSLGPLQAAEFTFDATLPGLGIAKWLRIKGNHVCTELRRRTWSLNMVASIATLTAPSGRRQLRGGLGNLPPQRENLPDI